MDVKIVKISVNILTWNCLDTLQDSLYPIMEEVKMFDSEVIVVDNGSDDGTDEFLADKDIVYKRYKRNMGISKGKNAGIKLSKGEYIMLLDADVLPVPNSIRLMVKYLDENPKQDAIGFYPNKWTNQKNKFQCKYHETFCEELFDVKPINRCCIYYGMYRRKIFDDGLMLNEEGEFGKGGYGWEDHDFFNRMKKRGIVQMVAHVNNEKGRYYHNINSSIRAMGRNAYDITSKQRLKAYRKIWKE